MTQTAKKLARRFKRGWADSGFMVGFASISLPCDETFAEALRPYDAVQRSSFDRSADTQLGVVWSTVGRHLRKAADELP